MAANIQIRAASENASPMESQNSKVKIRKADFKKAFGCLK